MKNYIVVIKTTEGSELFNFTSNEDRDEFIKMDKYHEIRVETKSKQFADKKKFYRRWRQRKTTMHFQT